MPEIPEIANRASEMDRALSGKTISNIEILQPKCLNLSPEEFRSNLQGAQIQETSHHGKWIKVRTDRGWLLLNLGMGGEILLTDRTRMPAKYRLIFDFSDFTCLTINFWWFGYAFYSPIDGLDEIKMIAKLGPNVLDLTEEGFITRIRTKKGRVKNILLDQSVVAGIGNAYIHDILFISKLHPNQPVVSLTDADFVRLYNAVREGLIPSLKKGGAFYEVNLFGEKGRFMMDDILVGYREGSPCPDCKTAIIKIKTGGTQSFICPTCQPKP